jgi:hypothetical protein
MNTLSTYNKQRKINNFNTDDDDDDDDDDNCGIKGYKQMEMS